jgi:microcystin-dependent protein
MNSNLYKIQTPADTDANWTSNNPVIPNNIHIDVTDKSEYKIGSGTAYASNPTYYKHIQSITGSGAATVTEPKAGQFVINVANSGGGDMVQSNYCKGIGSANTANKIDYSIYAETAKTANTATTANTANIANTVVGIRTFAMFPVGTPFIWFGNVAPEHTLLLQGQLVSRTTYSDLWNYISNPSNGFPLIDESALTNNYLGAFTKGDGSTTFRLPDYRQRIPVGYDTRYGGFNVLGYSAGESNHTLSINEMPSHNHSQKVSANVGSGTATRKDYEGDITKGGEYPQGINTGSTGGGKPHNNMQPYVVVNYLIVY